MELGMIGLGRMGANMAERLTRGGHRVVGFDASPQARDNARTRCAAVVDSWAALAQQLPAPRVLWLMVPAGRAVDEAIAALLPHVAAGDTFVDGGNSFYQDTQRRARELAERAIHYVDAGTSGGIWGLEKGYCMMVGGDPTVVARLRPIFRPPRSGAAAPTRVPKEMLRWPLRALLRARRALRASSRAARAWAQGRRA